MKITAEGYVANWLPKMEGWCTPEKASNMIEVVRSRRPSLAVEVGVFGGRSLFAIAIAMRDAGHGVVWGIDPWDIGAATEGDVGDENLEWWAKKVDLEKIYRGFVSDCVALEVLRECRWIRSRSEIAIHMFPDNTIDFFHLDSNHSELVSCRDVDLWHSKLRRNAVWVMDDTDWKTQAKALEKIDALGFKVVIDGGTYQILMRS